MALMRWNPERELLNVEREFSKLWNAFENRFGMKKDDDKEYENAVWSPMTDISEDDNNYYLQVDLPGVTKDDLKLNYQDGKLSISGERKEEREEKGKTYHRVERTFGKYYRQFNLPDTAIVDNIEAEFKEGQLKVVIPKSEEAKPKQLDIKIK